MLTELEIVNYLIQSIAIRNAQLALVKQQNNI